MSEHDSSDNDSDLDLSIEELAKRPCPQDSATEANNLPTPTPTLDLLGDDSSSSTSGDNNDGRYGLRRYGLRRRRAPINYKGMSQDSDDDDGENCPSNSKKPRKQKPRDVLDISSLLKNNPTTLKRLEKYIKDPERMENLPKWNIDMREIQQQDLEDLDPAHFELLQKFVRKCAKFLDQLILICDPAHRKPPSYWPKLLEFLTLIFNSATFLKTFYMKYYKEGRKNKEQIIQVLQIIKDSGQSSLNSLKLLSFLTGTNRSVITEEELNLIVELGQKEDEGNGISWRNIELGDGLLVKDENFGVVKCLEKLLQGNKDTLESLVLHGGLKGHPDIMEDKYKQKITFPGQMPKLAELNICAKYSFVSEPLESRNPESKRWREIRLDDNNSQNNPKDKENVELKPLKLTLDLGSSDFPALEKVVLGNLVEMNEFVYALMRKLKVFRCGSRWDLAIRFPKTEVKKGPSGLKELQLPDGLKDPTFVQKVGQFFPKLTKVWIYLPSVPVLRTFFKAYENSCELEELYLKTQFDFETTMEACLIPQLPLSGGGYGLSASSRTVISTLKEYKHFADYVRYHNIELPMEDEEDLAELRRSTAGIRALKSLQVLDMHHISRKLFIPNPEDERRWYDHNFKYLSTMFGFNTYPFSTTCHREILAMNLREYHWRSFNVPDSSTSHFRRAGFTSMRAVDLLSSDDDDLFTAVSHSRNKNNSSGRGSAKGVKVAIKPSMLIPDHMNKKKTES